MRRLCRLICAGLVASVTGTALLGAPRAQTPSEQASYPDQGTIIVGYSMTRAIGAPVRTIGGDEVGAIEDIVVGLDGMANQVLIALGGYFGVGEKRVVLPYDAVTFVGDHAVLSERARQDLEERPDVSYPGTSGILVARVPGSGTSASVAEEMQAYFREAAPEMQHWRQRMASFADDVAQGTRETSAEAENALRESWTTVESQWQRLTHATAESWQEVSHGFERARAEFERQWTEKGPGEDADPGLVN